MESPGEYLRRERELRRVTISRIFEATRVPVKALEALEADNYENLPHPTFVKGYIKSYCKAIGIDENDAVLRYEIYLRENAPDKSGGNKGVLPKKPVIPDDERLSFLRLSPSVRTYIIYGAAGIVLVLAGYLFFSGGSETETPPEETVAVQEQAPSAVVAEPSVATPQPEAGTVSTEVKVPVDDASKRVESKPSAAASGRHTLSVTAREVTWIKVRIDGKEPVEVILKVGESVSWDAAETFSLLIGNAGGVDMVYDGAKLAPLGRSGESVSLRLPRARTSQAGEGPKAGAQKPADVKEATPEGAGKKPQPARPEPAGTNQQ